eukprot:5117167-Amphidinium_carterae.1
MGVREDHQAQVFQLDPIGSDTILGQGNPCSTLTRMSSRQWRTTKQEDQRRREPLGPRLRRVGNQVVGSPTSGK